jgi:hypothetical protein
MQVAGYYTRDISLIREAVDVQTDVNIERLLKFVKRFSIPHKEKIEYRLCNAMNLLNLFDLKKKPVIFP